MRKGGRSRGFRRVEKKRALYFGFADRALLRDHRVDEACRTCALTSFILGAVRDRLVRLGRMLLFCISFVWSFVWGQSLTGLDSGHIDDGETTSTDQGS